MRYKSWTGNPEQSSVYYILYYLYNALLFISHLLMSMHSKLDNYDERNIKEKQGRWNWQLPGIRMDIIRTYIRLWIRLEFHRESSKQYLSRLGWRCPGKVCLHCRLGTFLSLALWWASPQTAPHFRVQSGVKFKWTVFVMTVIASSSKMPHIILSLLNHLIKENIVKIILKLNMLLINPHCNSIFQRANISYYTIAACILYSRWHKVEKGRSKNLVRK